MIRWFPFSTTYPQIVLGILTTAVVVTVLFGVVTSSVAFGSYNLAWDGTSELRQEADDVADETIIATDTDRYESIEANGTVAFVIAPDEQYEVEESNRMRSFVERGGTLVIADDRPERANSLLTGLNSTVQIDGGTVRDERNYYRVPSLPRATETAEQGPADDVDELALNHGTILEAGNATVLVRTSEYAYVDRNRNEELDDSESLATYPVVVAEELGQGTVVVVSDASILINAMIDRSDNRVFVRSLADTDRVLIDTSHGDQIPPLIAVVLVVRNSPLLQLFAGLVAITLVSVWGAGGFKQITSRIAAAFSFWRSEYDQSSDIDLDRSEIVSAIELQYPHWDESDREQITTAVISQRYDTVPDDGPSSRSRRDPDRDGERPDR